MTFDSWALGGAALVYIGSCTFAGTDLAGAASLVFRADIVLVSALTGSDEIFIDDFGGTSAGSC